MTSNNVPTYFEKEINSFVKSFTKKLSHKSSYMIPKGPSEERCGD